MRNNLRMQLLRLLHRAGGRRICTPAAAVPSVSAEQESRIARLEASLASAIEKIGKSNDSVKPPDSGIA